MVTREVLRMLGHRYPFSSGHLRVVRSAPFRYAARGPVEPVWATLRDGSSARVRLDEPIGRAMYFLGDYDPKITWLLRQVLRPGDEMLDLGANLGVYALQAARMVGPTGTVHAVEPQPELCALLRASAARNGFGQLHVHEVALSDRTGTTALFTHPNSAKASLHEPEVPLGRTQVRTVQAEEFLRREVGPVRALKIDVEGHEATVLGAATHWLADVQPPVVLFESHTTGGPFLERPTVRLLRDAGYVLVQFPKALRAVHLVDVPADGRLLLGFDFVAMTPAARATLAARF